MTQNKQDWDDLGRDVLDIIDRAINTRDYQKLNQSIRQAVSRAVDLGGEAVRRSVTPDAAPKQDLSVYYQSPASRWTGAVLKNVFGGIVTGLSVLLLIGSMALNLMPVAVISMLGLGGGGWLIHNGCDMLGKIKRFKCYRKTLGQKTQCALEKLARSVGKSVAFVRRDLWQMIRAGYFPQGHMDKEQTCLIISDETYRLFEQSRLAMEAQKREEAAQPPPPVRDARVQEVLDRGSDFIDQIHRCNDAIPGPEISAKIDRMETIVRRIFLRVEAHPEIVPDLKKLMDYYLPMTVKLLNAYAEMDAQPIQGETIANSKREIESTLDTLNAALEKLLDDLFADTALDISSDITVLQTLLAQEGLTNDEFARLRRETH